MKDNINFLFHQFREQASYIPSILYLFLLTTFGIILAYSILHAILSEILPIDPYIFPTTVIFTTTVACCIWIYSRFNLTSAIKGLLGVDNVKFLSDSRLLEYQSDISKLIEAAGVNPNHVRIHVIESTMNNNAFALSPLFHLHSHIIVPSGILSHLSKDEMLGIIGHELSHVKHRDGQFKIPLGFIHFAASNLPFISKAAAVLVLLFIAFPLLGDEGILFPLFFLVPTAFVLLHRFLERRVELRADLLACQWTGNPQAMVSGLRKITEFESIGVAKFFDTHPSFSEREKYILASHQNYSDHHPIACD